MLVGCQARASLKRLVDSTTLTFVFSKWLNPITRPHRKSRLYNQGMQLLLVKILQHRAFVALYRDFGASAEARIG